VLLLPQQPAPFPMRNSTTPGAAEETNLQHKITRRVDRHSQTMVNHTDILIADPPASPLTA